MIKLTRFCHQDIPHLLVHLNNPNVTKFLSSRLPSPYTEVDAIYWVEEGHKQGAISYAIECDGVFCGAVGIYLQEDNTEAEIGYWLGEAFWGSSIASRAIFQLCERIFTTTEIRRIYNPVTELNVRSIRVMEKCGFIKVAELNDSVFHEGVYVDEWVYEKVKKEQ